MHRTLRYLGVREADINDVFQEVFLVVHRRLEEFEGRASLKTWLYQIARHAASDQRRRAYMRNEVPTAEPALGRADGGVSRSAQLEARQLLLQALDQLDDDKRAVFVLFEVEGMTMNEVVEVLGCPLQTAYSRLHAARKIVAEQVQSLAEGAA